MKIQPTIGLVSCGAKKLTHAAAARHLYTSPLFQLSRAYAERTCSVVYVISALHGLVELDHMIKPYDSRLGKRSVMERDQWARVIASRLVARHGRDATYVILAGKEYADPIATALQTIDGMRDGADGYRWRGVSPDRIVRPLEGMQIGERLAWLTAQARSAA